MNKVELLKLLTKDFAEVSFKDSWANGTGYFDNAVKDDSITEPSKFEDPHGRYGVIVPVKNGKGSLVVFQRRLGTDVIVINKADSIRDLENDWYAKHPSVELSSSLTEETVSRIFVGHDNLMQFMGY